MILSNKNAALALIVFLAVFVAHHSFALSVEENAQRLQAMTPYITQLSDLLNNFLEIFNAFDQQRQLFLNDSTTDDARLLNGVRSFGSKFSAQIQAINKALNDARIKGAGSKLAEEKASLKSASDAANILKTEANAILNLNDPHGLNSVVDIKNIAKGVLKILDGLVNLLNDKMRAIDSELALRGKKTSSVSGANRTFIGRAVNKTSQPITNAIVDIGNIDVKTVNVSGAQVVTTEGGVRIIFPYIGPKESVGFIISGAPQGVPYGGYTADGGINGSIPAANIRTLSPITGSGGAGQVYARPVQPAGGEVVGPFGVKTGFRFPGNTSGSGGGAVSPPPQPPAGTGVGGTITTPSGGNTNPVEGTASGAAGATTGQGGISNSGDKVRVGGGTETGGTVFGPEPSFVDTLVDFFGGILGGHARRSLGR